MSTGPLAVHICTRNRPATVGQLCNDLAVVLDGWPAEVTVYDDSTTPRWRAATAAAAAQARIPVRYLDEAQRRALVDRAATSVPAAAECLNASRRLGARGWDLAGVRFTAFLQGALDRDPDRLHLFLDDDLRLVSCDYAGDHYDVDVNATRAGLVPPDLDADLFAAGAKLRGRADLSAIEHLEQFLATGATGEDMDFPAAVYVDPHIHPESPGISGGFLLTNRRSLRTVLLSRSYNEDWIWLRQLALAGGTVTPLELTAVHAGTTRLRLSVDVVALQFDGEVLDAALRRCAEDGHPLDAWGTYVDEAVDLCRQRLDAVVRRSSPAAGAGAMLRAARYQVQRRRPADYRASIAEHVRRSAQWASAFT